MAWDTKYRLEFTDILSLDWKVDIEDETAASSVTALEGTGTPLIFNFLPGGSTLFEGIIYGSSVDINIYSNTNFQWSTFYSYDKQQYRVSIYQGSDTLFWRGFINSEDYQEPYNGTVYPVTISASDGLGQLKDMPYKYTTTTVDDTYYTGYKTDAAIVYDILGKIQHTSFIEYVNLYSAHMDDAVTDSPLNQLLVNVDVFKDMDCYEVLENLLKKYNAIIRQSNGIINIYRPAELYNDTIYGRIFTSATANTDTSLSPALSLNRTTSVTDISDVEGGTMMIQPPVKKITVNQDYGNVQSWIQNWDFKSNTYVPSPTFKYANWTYYGGTGTLPIGNLIPGETDGIALLRTASNPPLYNVSQSFGTYALTTSDVFILEFDYLHFVSVATSDIHMFVRVKADGGAYYLVDVGDGVSAQWSGTAGYLLQDDLTVPQGNSGWKHYKRYFAGLPIDGSYTISLYSPYADAGVVLGFNNVRFYSTSDEIVRTTHKRKFRERWTKKKRFMGIEWTLNNKYNTVISVNDVEEIISNDFIKTNSISGLETDYDYIIGDITDANIDNVIEQFNGAIGYSSAGTVAPTTAWSRYGGSEATPLLDLIADEIINQGTRPTQQLSLPIFESANTSNDPHVNLLGCYSDDLNLYNSVTRKFMLNSGTFNVKDRYWDVDLLEIVLPVGPDAAPSGLTATHLSDTSIQVDWTDNASNETGYSIERSTDGVNYTVVALGGADSETITDTTCEPSTLYYYRCRAYLGGVYSAYSNVDSDTTDAGAGVVVTLNHVDSITTQEALSYFDPNVSFEATVTGSGTVRIYWAFFTGIVKRVTGYEDIAFSAGTGTYTFADITVPYWVTTGCNFRIGKTTAYGTISNDFEVTTPV